MLVLSLFPGIGLLDRGFELEGFTVVRGPDLVFGGDIRTFHPPAGVFGLVIGGPPCQDFSSARRSDPTGNGEAMLKEFKRVVREAEPDAWLMENVARVPSVRLAGYRVQRIDVDAGWFSMQSRLRHIQFGVKDESNFINIPKGRKLDGCEPAAMASDGRTFRELCRLQGLPDSFKLDSFTTKGKKMAVGNGVPIPMARTLARAVRDAFSMDQATTDQVKPADARRRRCSCGCGRPVGGVDGFQLYASPACRKREQRRRDRESGTRRKHA